MITALVVLIACNAQPSAAAATAPPAHARDDITATATVGASPTLTERYDAPRPGDAYSSYTILQTLFTDVLAKLAQRHASIGALGTDAAKWARRQADVKAALNGTGSSAAAAAAAAAAATASAAATCCSCRYR